jgi:probable selenium-dependent hydroxylase accessory protein YqeC
VFLEQFKFDTPSVVNVVGGGGKTSLILTLLAEFPGPGAVLYSTTTRIHPPDPASGVMLVASDNEELLRCMVMRTAETWADRTPRLVVTRPRLSEELLAGVSPQFALGLVSEHCRLVLNEADGARSMSLKMPRDNEPVLMEQARYLVPVVGLDCLNRPLGPDTLFRWELARERHALREGTILTPNVVASLLLHPQGVCKGWRTGTEIIPFINKADDEDTAAASRELAEALLRSANFPVSRVVVGSIHNRRVASVAA